MEEEKKTQPTKVVGYLNPKYVNLITREAQNNNIPVSKIVKTAIKEYYDKRAE